MDEQASYEVPLNAVPFINMFAQALDDEAGIAIRAQVNSGVATHVAINTVAVLMIHKAADLAVRNSVFVGNREPNGSGWLNVASQAFAEAVERVKAVAAASQAAAEPAEETHAEDAVSVDGQNGEG